MDSFDSGSFRPRRNNSIDIRHKGAQDGQDTASHRPIADLVNAISKLLISLSRAISTSDPRLATSNQGSLQKRLKNETERFYLWGFDMSVSNGCLDVALSRNADVRDAIVATLFDLGRVLLLWAHQEPLQSNSSCQLASDELIHVSDRISRENTDLDELSAQEATAYGEDESYDLDDLLDEVDTYIVCLLDVSMAMGDLFGDSFQSSSMDMVHESDTETLPSDNMTSVDGPNPRRMVEDTGEQRWETPSGAVAARTKQQQRAATWNVPAKHTEPYPESDEQQARECIAIRIAAMRALFDSTNTDKGRVAVASKAGYAGYSKATAKQEARRLHPMMTGSHNVPVEYHSTQSSSTHWMVRMLRKPSKLTLPLAITVGAARQRRIVRVQ